MDFAQWEEHFKHNGHHLDHISFDNDHISPSEIDLITRSIQQFQRGENSEGKHLIRFAKNSSFPRYQEAIVYFIKEEQRHAMILGKWMKRHDIKPIKSHWVDNVFRKLRRFSNLENSVRILLTAEVIAAVYYKALQKATSSPTLKSICQQILIDEAIHLDFQCFTINHFQSRRSKPLKMFHDMKQRVLMTGTVLVVWKEHRSVLKAGGHDFLSFVRDVFNQLDVCIRQTAEGSSATLSPPLYAR